MSEGKRIYALDLFRGTAVILMVVYHTVYTFGTVIGFGAFKSCFKILEPFAPNIIATMFILTCAYSCSLSKSNFKRGAQIFCIGLGLSGVTIFILPLIGIKGEGIYFGILHFLGVALMLSPLIFKAVKKVPFYIGIPVLTILSIGMRDLTNKGFFSFPVTDPFSDTVNVLFPLGIYHQGFYSADYYAVFPWIFVFAIGCYISVMLPKEKLGALFYKKKCAPVEFIGRHALIIYVIHQPIIYAIGYVISLIQT